MKSPQQMKRLIQNEKHIIVIIDPAVVVRSGLRSILEKQFSQVSFVEAEDLRLAIQDYQEENSPELIILSHAKNDESAQQLQYATSYWPGAKTLLLVKGLSRNGLDKIGPADTLLPFDVHASKLVTEVRNLLQQKKKNSVQQKINSPISKLSKKELLILRYVSEGKSSAEIAKALHNSVRTISNHRYRIIKKLGLNKPNQLLLFGIQNINEIKEELDKNQ